MGRLADVGASATLRGDAIVALYTQLALTALELDLHADATTGAPTAGGAKASIVEG